MRRALIALALLWACDDGADVIDVGAPPAPDVAEPADSALDEDDSAVPDAGGEGDSAVPDADDSAMPDAGREDDSAMPDAGGEDDTAVPDGGAEDDSATPDAAREDDSALPDAGEPREIACFDGLDGDDDGRVDCADPDCRGAGACFGVVEDCADGVDNTGDDHVDCADVTCAEACPVPDVPAFDDEELQALLLARCTPCHVGGGSDGAMRLDPPFRDAIVNVISSQVPELRVKPGDRQNSYLYRKVAYTFREVPGGGGEGMPPVEPLSRTELERLGRWIEAL